MRGQTDFVLVNRLIHGDQMMIPKWLADKYPERFEVVVPEEPKAPRKTRKKVGSKGVARTPKED